MMTGMLSSACEAKIMHQNRHQIEKGHLSFFLRWPLNSCFSWF